MQEHGTKVTDVGTAVDSSASASGSGVQSTGVNDTQPSAES